MHEILCIGICLLSHRCMHSTWMHLTLKYVCPGRMRMRISKYQDKSACLRGWGTLSKGHLWDSIRTWNPPAWYDILTYIPFTNQRTSGFVFSVRQDPIRMLPLCFLCTSISNQRRFPNISPESLFGKDSRKIHGDQKACCHSSLKVWKDRTVLLIKSLRKCFSSTRLCCDVIDC